MPKVQFINPDEVRKPRQLEFKPVPINQYNKTIEDEKENFSKEDFLRIFNDMVVIREFETMLNLIKTRGEYNGHPLALKMVLLYHKNRLKALKNQVVLIRPDDSSKKADLTIITLSYTKLITIIMLLLLNLFLNILT